MSYWRPARRPGFGGVIRPGSVALVPWVLVIVDNSGSMGHRDLALALGLIGKVLVPAISRLAPVAVTTGRVAQWLD